MVTAREAARITHISTKIGTLASPAQLDSSTTRPLRVASHAHSLATHANTQMVTRSARTAQAATFLIQQDRLAERHAQVISLSITRLWALVSHALPGPSLKMANATIALLTVLSAKGTTEL